MSEIGQEIVIDDDFKSLIRPLTNAEYRQLEESILKEGCRDALVLWGSTLVDGHHRYEICRKHSIPFKTVEREFASRDEAEVWIIDNQLGRRNLPLYVKGELWLKKQEILNLMEKAKAKKLSGLKQYQDVQTCTTVFRNSEKREELVDTTKNLAERIGCHPDTASRIIQIHKEATEEQKRRLWKDEVSINEIYNEIKKVEKIVLIDIDDLGVDVCNIREGEWIRDKELIRDIENNGIINPLTVRPAGNKYAIVCGSRRYHAAIEAGLTEVPCIIKEIDDITAMGLSIAENRYIDSAPEWLYVLKMGEMYQRLITLGRSREEIIEIIVEKTGFSQDSVQTFLEAACSPKEIIELMKPPSERSDAVKELLKEMHVFGAASAVLSVEKAAKLATELKDLPIKKKFEVAAYIMVLEKEAAFEIIEEVKVCPKESMEGIREIVRGIPKGRRWWFEFSSNLVNAMEEMCVRKNMNIKQLVEYSVETVLRNEGYL